MFEMGEEEFAQGEEAVGGVVLEDRAGAGGVGEEAGGDVADFVDGEGGFVD